MNKKNDQSASNPLIHKNPATEPHPPKEGHSGGKKNKKQRIQKKRKKPDRPRVNTFIILSHDDHIIEQCTYRFIQGWIACPEKTTLTAFTRILSNILVIYSRKSPYHPLKPATIRRKIYHYVTSPATERKKTKKRDSNNP